MIGEVVGSYRITDKIATGGMGVVYKAEHSLIGKTAAVKLLRREYSEHREIIDRFFNEAKATTAIRHPGIIDIYDFGYHQDGRAYIVMEFLAGETLKQRLRARGVLAPDVASRLIRSVASAVGAAHERGIIHRDLKPDNIVLVPDPEMVDGERVKVLDFGLAKLSDGRSAGMSTQAGVVLGTPTYMAPEQTSGRITVDSRVDVYALGCILFELVCGRPPFVSNGSLAQILMAHQNEPPPRPRSLNGAVSESLERIILRLLAKAPEQRFQTMAEVRDALAEYAGEVSELPVAVLIESTEPNLVQPAQQSATGSGPYAAHMSTLNASAGQMFEQASPSQQLYLHSRAHSMAGHDSGVHAGSGMHRRMSQQLPQQRLAQQQQRRSALPWVFGAVASIALGMGIVFVVGSSRGSAPSRSAIPAEVVDSNEGGNTGAGPGEPPPPQTAAATAEPAAATPSPAVPAGSEHDAAVAPVEQAAAGEEPAAAEAEAPEIEMAPDVVENAPAGPQPGAPSAQPAPVKVKLVIVPDTPDVKITVDSQVRTDNPLVLQPRSEPYRVKVQAKGFESKIEWVRATKDRIVTIELDAKTLDL